MGMVILYFPYIGEKEVFDKYENVIQLDRRSFANYETLVNVACETAKDKIVCIEVTAEIITALQRCKDPETIERIYVPSELWLDEYMDNLRNEYKKSYDNISENDVDTFVVGMKVAYMYAEWCKLSKVRLRRKETFEDSLKWFHLI